MAQQYERWLRNSCKYFSRLYNKANKVWPDNSRYQGMWAEDQMHGLGKLIHSDGDVYEGEWAYDMATGHGDYKHMGGGRYVG